MDKRALLERLRSELTAAIDVMEHAAKTAHAAATHPEMKPENDKDTRGLEAGYLAAGQSTRAAEMRRLLGELNKIAPKNFTKTDAIDSTALVELVDENGKKMRVFISPAGAGMKVGDVQIVTPESPLGDELVGKRVGDVVELNAAGKMRELEIVGVS